MFGLFDIPAWFVWALGSAIQQVAFLFSSKAFKLMMQGRAPTLATDVLVKRINLQMLEIGKMYLQLCATPLVLTLAYTVHGYCIYCGASLLTSGTIKECSKFLDALDWFIRFQLIRSTGFAGTKHDGVRN